MLRRIWHFVSDSRHLTIAGFVALAVFLYVGADVLELALIWVVALMSLALLAWLVVWLLRRRRARRDAQALGQAIINQAEAAEAAAARTMHAAGAGHGELDAVRTGLLGAIDTIRSSKLGLKSGAGALYELPWYLIIGNPAAGKSSAILHSGLQFPVAGNPVAGNPVAGNPVAGASVVQGVGGTRNCDWFFTTDGIVLDTAGRYAVQDEHRGEWFGFLDLLKKYRRKAPINGILIAVSIAELGASPDSAMQLARSLRKRVQDVIERLEVFAPLYIVFTKADLIAGFGEFFADAERSERERVWGATMAYQRKQPSAGVLAFFDQSFDELQEGLNQLSLANMAQRQRKAMAPGVFTFPLEFAAIKPALRAFIATLLEENPFQFQPVFRGFYLTSALQEGTPVSASSLQVARRFDLASAPAPAALPGQAPLPQHGYFLLELFRKVIFADKELVSHYASRARVRLKYAVFFGATIALGASLALWSWSYLGNRQLLANVAADMDKVVRLQAQRLDLQSRLEALEILQDRIEQLQAYRAGKPWSLRMGLYQGELLERKLRAEYFAGARHVMLEPVTASLEELLTEMNAHAELLQPAARSPVLPASAPGAPYQAASATNVEDAYNALKTYLMLADKTHADSSHLNDQLTRYWRGWLEGNRGNMPREQMIRSAERLMTFYLAQTGDPAWPRVAPRLALIDAARDNLRRVVRGMPARERVYADIRARAATRFAGVTVARLVGEQDQALIAGSHAISGAYTREAWQQYVQGAFRDAANRELSSADWVLKSASTDDLTLEGSPEQIEKNLVALYKADYAREWLKFVQGVTVADMQGLDGAVRAMNRLGDPQTSPLARLLTQIAQQTSWDNPALHNAQLHQAERGVIAWFKDTFLRRAPSQLTGNAGLNAQLDPARLDQPGGPVGSEFAGVARLVAARDKDASLLRSYLEALSRLRSRLNLLKNQGDPGPGARQLMQQTLEGSGSELADALKLVDEQMLTGMSEAQKQAIRPILVRPLMQTFAVIVAPAELEVNRTWAAQVHEPFQRSLAHKYPFTPSARIEASNLEIGQFFGPDGLVAKFVTSAMGPLVVRRGDVLAPRTWAGMGISLSPQMVARFPGWIAPLGAGGVAVTSSAAQTVFQVQPLPSPGMQETMLEIDGQQLRYRNTPPQWTNMVHPGPLGPPGAKISAVTFDGRTVELFNEAGQFGLKRMIDAASKQRKDGGVFALRWTRGEVSVALELKIISSAETSGAPADAALPERGFRGMQLPVTIISHDATPAATAATPVAAAP